MYAVGMKEIDRKEAELLSESDSDSGRGRPAEPGSRERVAERPTIAAWSEMPGPAYHRCTVPVQGLERAGLVRVAGCAIPPTPRSVPTGDIVLAHVLRSAY